MEINNSLEIRVQILGTYAFLSTRLQQKDFLCGREDRKSSPIFSVYVLQQADLFGTLRISDLHYEFTMMSRYLLFAASRRVLTQKQCISFWIQRSSLRSQTDRWFHTFRLCFATQAASK